MRTHGKVVGALVAVALHAACGGAGGGDVGAVPSFADVTFGSALSQIRGHHRVALELYREGDREGALVHAGHPIGEILSTVQPRIRLADRGAATRLAEQLDRVADAVQEGRPAGDVANAISGAARAVSAAETEVVQAFRTSRVYNGSVVAAVLATAAREYAVAVQGGSVGEIVEYQDAFGFVREARRRYGGIRPSVRAFGAIEATQIEEAFDRLEESMPSPAPPPKPVRHEEVLARATLIGQKIQETVGAVLAPERKPREIIERIGALLGDALERYAAGKAEEAADLVTEAYLENYELVELDVIRLAPELNAQIEPLLASDLRNRIAAGPPIAELRAEVTRIRDLLGRALQRLESGA